MSEEKLSIDFTFLEGKAVLHLVHTATRSSATFLKTHGAELGQSVYSFWLVFVMNWCLIYTGLPDRLYTDQGSVFASERWKQLADLNDVQLRLSRIEAHSSLGTDDTTNISVEYIGKSDTIVHKFSLAIS